MAQATVGIMNSPIAGAILADTGALTMSAISPTILITTQYAARATLALRNATNDADLWSHLIKTSSDSPIVATGVGSVTIGLNQRLVIRAESDMIGEVQASILL